jgi:hypothetical protein
MLSALLDECWLSIYPAVGGLGLSLMAGEGVAEVLQ